jgi:hypothetical protein
MTKIEILASLIKLQDTDREEYKKERESLTAEFEEKCKIGWKQEFPRRKFDMQKFRTQLPGLNKAILANYQPIANWLSCFWGNEKRRLEKLIGELCDAPEVLPTSIPGADVVLDEVSSCSYSTQGWGAEGYARGAAEQVVRQATALGIKSWITTEQTEYKSTYYHVHGETDEIGKYIIRNKSVSLLDWAVSCWKSGVNPKVYNPRLPDSLFDKSLEIYKLHPYPESH